MVPVGSDAVAVEELSELVVIAELPDIVTVLPAVVSVVLDSVIVV